MEVPQGNRNCNHSLKREKPARCAGIPLEPLNECCLAVKRMPLGSMGLILEVGCQVNFVLGTQRIQPKYAHPEACLQDE